MIEIKDLLLRFKDILFSEEGKKEVIVNAIKKATHLSINTENMAVKNGIVYLTTKPIYKNEIALKKELILNELQTLLGKKAPYDIR